MFYIELHPLKVQPPEQQRCPELALPPHLFVKIEHKMSTYHISQLFSNWTQRKLCFHDAFIRCTQAFTILRKKNKSQNKKLCSFPLLWSTDTLHTTCNLLLIDIIAYIKGRKKKEKKISQYNFMQAPKLFKQNTETLYNITEMQTNNSEVFYNKK